MVQLAAWTGMFFEYGRAHGVSAGLQMTLNGENPCPLCKFVEAATPEALPAAQLAGGFLPLVPPPVTEGSLLVPPLGQRSVYLCAGQMGITLATVPATPPPRAAI